MKSNKRLIEAAVSLALAAGMAFPSAVGAQSATATAAQPDIAGFCKAVAAMSARVEERLSEGSAKIGSKRGDLEARLESLKGEHESKLKDLREKEDAKRSERIAGLDDNADTDAERQALQKFQSDVAAAVTARRAATDAANDAFRDGLKGLIAARKAAVDAATGTFAVAVRDALAKAKADCASGLAPAKVRGTLMDALKAAREKLQSDLQDIAKLGPQVQPLIETRRKAHQDAMTAFHAAVEEAKTELKTAFGA
ncbi:MAG TPA: hypothetical protein VL283_02685 [Candidatus Baltobacteraceae bacterium]|nr:hypothetical protein [Candidatus Baltobacteraceae bacterium]